MGQAVDDLIAKWQGAEGGQERANYAMFLTELCGVLGVAAPDAAAATTEHNDYVFERAVTFANHDGTASKGRIDLYKRGCFVLEAKQSRIEGGGKEVDGQSGVFIAGSERKQRSDRQWDVRMLNARQQAENYARGPARIPRMATLYRRLRRWTLLRALCRFYGQGPQLFAVSRSAGISHLSRRYSKRRNT